MSKRKLYDVEIIYEDGFVENKPGLIRAWMIVQVNLVGTKINLHGKIQTVIVQENEI